MFYASERTTDFLNSATRIDLDFFIVNFLMHRINFELFIVYNLKEILCSSELVSLLQTSLTAVTFY